MLEKVGQSGVNVALSYFISRLNNNTEVNAGNKRVYGLWTSESETHLKVVLLLQNSFGMLVLLLSVENFQAATLCLNYWVNINVMLSYFCLFFFTYFAEQMCSTLYKVFLYQGNFCKTSFVIFF